MSPIIALISLNVLQWTNYCSRALFVIGPDSALGFKTVWFNDFAPTHLIPLPDDSVAIPPVPPSLQLYCSPAVIRLHHPLRRFPAYSNPAGGADMNYQYADWFAHHN